MPRTSRKPPARRTAPRRRAAAAAAPAAVEQIERELGPRIALVRRRARLTLEQLAAATGFTKGYLSRIENSRVVPPIGTLVRLTSALGLGLQELLAIGVEPQDERVIFVKRGDEAALVHGGTSFGYDYLALAGPRSGRHIMPFVMIFPEGVYADVRFDHEGDEFLYLLKGRVSFEVVVDGQPRLFNLAPGDSLFFDSTLPHRGRSLGGEAKALIVVAQAGKRR
jgi:transcriptional regulator with XRE-family HTH domain